jgi:hypothetical protein
MHEGSAKIWYGIPYSALSTFEFFLKSTKSSLFNKDPDLLSSINLQVHPMAIRSAQIPIFRTIQHPGELILTFPGSYHSGVS